MQYIHAHWLHLKIAELSQQWAAILFLFLPSLAGSEGRLGGSAPHFMY